MAVAKVMKEEFPDEFTLTEKKFYEMKIKALNEKIERIKQRSAELEKENKDTKNQYKTLEEESAETVAYLKRSIAQKHDEIRVITEKLAAFQASKAMEKEKYQEQLATLEKDYKNMHDTFTAEVKLLSGQLSSLESFKNNREAMVKKMIALEEELRRKDEHHALSLRNNENKYILMKEKLSGYIEERLLRLSLDLQKQNKSKLADTMQNVIKENIAINNELNIIITSWQKLFNENESIRGTTKKLEQEVAIMSGLKDKAMEKNAILNKLIERLIYEQERMHGNFKEYIEQNIELRRKLEEKTAEAEEAWMEAQEKKELYNKSQEELRLLKEDWTFLKHQNTKLEKIVKSATIQIQEAIRLQENKTVKTITDEDEFMMRRHLLNSLHDLFNSFSLFQEEKLEEDLVEEEEEEEEELDDWQWVKRSPVLRKCPFIKKIKQINNNQEQL